MAKLIILRGPSGAGKSSVARELHQRITGQVALIDQDYYRITMLRPQGSLPELRLAMMLSDIKLALDHGCTVILEGILSMTSYKEFFANLFQYHPESNYMFYFDVSFPETVRRHATRAKSKEFGETDMKEWYKFGQKSNFDFEKIITEASTLDETVAYILSTTGLDT